jgi:hypothetical protein
VEGGEHGLLVGLGAVSSIAASDDDELLAAVLKAANDKARKMGWIV